MALNLPAKLTSIYENPLAIATAGVVIGFAIGRFTAQISTANYLKASAPRRTEKSNNKTNPGSALQDDDEESDDQGELQDFKSNNEECKLVLVVRTDLGMTKGKIAAQCSHATLACYKALVKQEAANQKSFSMLRRWENWGQAKVTVQVKSEDELLLLQAQAMSLGLCAKIVHDAGRTQIASGSATVLGIGPGPKSVVDQVTGHLKLL